MRNRLSPWLLLIGLSLYTLRGAAWADGEQAAPAATAPLSLSQCIATALQRQTDVLVGEQSVTAAQAQYTQARSGYYPQVSVQYNKNLVTSGTQYNGVDGPSVSVTQNFYDGGLREAKVARSNYTVEQVDASLDRTKQTVIYSVTSSYLALLRAQHLATVDDKRVEYINGQLEMVRACAAAGSTAEVDVLPIEAQLANARVDQLAAKNSIRTAAINLQLAMGLTPAADYAIQDVKLPSKITIPTQDECLKLALEQRPEVNETKAGIGVAQASVKSAKIALRPQPTISGTLEQPLTGGNKQIYSINAGISFDVFDGQSNQAAYREAKANLTSAELRSEQTVKDITADVQNAYVTINNSHERVDASTLSVAAAQRNLDAQDERYKRGLAIPLDLLNAQLELSTARSNEVEAEYDYLTALAQLHYAMGKQGEVTWE